MSIWDDNMKNRMGTVIRKKRSQKGMTQEQLSELVSTTPGFIGQIERAEAYPSAQVLAKIVEVLGIDANTLFFDIDENSVVVREISIRVQRLDPEKQEFVLDMISLIERLARNDKEKVDH